MRRDDDQDWDTITGAHDELSRLREADDSDADAKAVERYSDRIADQVGSTDEEFLAQVQLAQFETRAFAYGRSHILRRVLHSLERGLRRRMNGWNILPDFAWLAGVCALLRVVRTCTPGLPFL